jgi:Ca2+/Na+ antiporter
MMVVMMATILKISPHTVCSPVPLLSSVNQPKALVAREVYQVDITTTICRILPSYDYQVGWYFIYKVMMFHLYCVYLYLVIVRQQEPNLRILVA